MKLLPFLTVVVLAVVTSILAQKTPPRPSPPSGTGHPDRPGVPPGAFGGPSGSGRLKPEATLNFGGSGSGRFKPEATLNFGGSRRFGPRRSKTMWIYSPRCLKWTQVEEHEEFPPLSCPAVFHDPRFSKHRSFCSSFGSLHRLYSGSSIWSWPSWGYCAHLPYALCPALQHVC